MQEPVPPPGRLFLSDLGSRIPGRRHGRQRHVEVRRRILIPYWLFLVVLVVLVVVVVVRLVSLLSHQVLRLDEPGVGAAALDQLPMRAALDLLALGDDDDVVGTTHSRQPVRNHHHGAALGHVVEGCLHNLLGVGVERARRLIQQQHLGVRDDGAGDDDALLLPAR